MPLTIPTPDALRIAQALLQSWPKTGKAMVPFIGAILKAAGYHEDTRFMGSTTVYVLGKIRYMVKAREVRIEVQRQGTSWEHHGNNIAIADFFGLIAKDLLAALKGTPLEAQLQQKLAAKKAARTKTVQTAAFKRDVAYCYSSLAQLVTWDGVPHLDQVAPTWVKLQAAYLKDPVIQEVARHVIWWAVQSRTCFLWAGDDWVDLANNSAKVPADDRILPLNPNYLDVAGRRALVDLVGSYAFLPGIDQLTLSSGFDMTPDLRYRTRDQVLVKAAQAVAEILGGDAQQDAIPLMAATRRLGSAASPDSHHVAAWLAQGGHLASMTADLSPSFWPFRSRLGWGLPGALLGRVEVGREGAMVPIYREHIAPMTLWRTSIK